MLYWACDDRPAQQKVAYATLHSIVGETRGNAWRKQISLHNFTQLNFFDPPTSEELPTIQFQSSHDHLETIDDRISGFTPRQTLDKRVPCLIREWSRPRDLHPSIQKKVTVGKDSCLLNRSFTRFVCRAWRALANDPFLPEMHFSRTAKKNPCLMLYADIPLRSQLSFINISSNDTKGELANQIHVPFGDKMPEFDIIGSCNGLLCLHNSLFKDPIFVYNPFTQTCIELPKSVQYSIQEVVFGFGYHPKACEYKIVKIAYYRTSPNGQLLIRRSDVQVFTLGSDSWRSIGKMPYILDGCRPSEALVNGRLHWVTGRRNSHQIVSFDLADEQFRQVQGPAGSVWNWLKLYLAVLDGCLTATIYRHSGRLEIWMMKDYDVPESWIKQYSIRPTLPRGLFKNNPRTPSRIWRKVLYGRTVRVLCRLKNGEILLECKGKALISYDSKNEKFTILTIDKMPNSFQTVVHVGCLNWIDTPIHGASLEIKELLG
ncbi:F-box associated domain, type 3 [Dillenia turbinata]|uniref:F-box associated domain, type 3 n=1 Tax=Dillenia turbinata TaxID=194707 RepID=A0AAN8Z2Y3_9MAGN